MITRSNLAEQLREYQIRSKHDWASVSFFTSTANPISSPCQGRLPLKKYISAYPRDSKSSFRLCSMPRADGVIYVVWELIILAFLVFSAVSLYFRYMRLAFILICITMMLLVCMKITKQVRLARRRKGRMLLPLSM